jgi:ATP-dependent Lon protease
MSEYPSSICAPVLALRGLVVFPGMVTHFDVGRERSAHAVEEAMRTDQRIFLVAQRELQTDDPQKKELFSVGTVAQVRQILRMPGDNMRILVEGQYRAKLADMVQTDPYLFARLEKLEDEPCNPALPRAQALLREGHTLFEQFVELGAKLPQDSLMQLLASKDPAYVADYIGQNSTMDYPQKQKILEQLHPVKRLELAVDLLTKELDILRLENDISEKVQKSVDKGQRDYYLREQLHAIQEELGESPDEEGEDEYREKIMALHLPEETEEKLLKETRRLSQQQGNSAESAVLRTYLDTVLDLPWNTRTEERLNVKQAEKILNEDHYGLENVKKRILETIAVRQLAPDMPCQILCLVGPPGVGKTSVAISIARALNRKLARLSLGGVHDEAEIRGHRKTYIGAMPGRIMAAVAQAKSKNALLLLDEVDKLGSDYKGDPSSALLEVLDSEQNNAFRDHYLEVPFDLSECMFITTANTTETIPRPLLDRMEVIELGSYTDEEKLQIAKRHLIPKQLAKHGLNRTRVHLTDDAIREIITCYTRESGVRQLERELAQICRRCAMRFVSDNAPRRITVTGGNLEQILGVRKFIPDELPQTDLVGVVTGLAWTSVGGETLEVEVNVVDGSGKLELTGNLGDVMKESVYAAVSYIRSRAAEYELPADFYKTKDIHVHFPEGAVPKDGPSAGIAICTAILSALTGATVRREIAMTGEISIRGRVLPIGGLKEKTMAALRHGIKTVIIPADNEKDLEEIDQTVRSALNFITVRHVDTVIAAALDFSACRKIPLKTFQPAAPLSLPQETPAQRKPGIRQ